MNLEILRWDFLHWIKLAQTIRFAALNTAIKLKMSDVLTCIWQHV